MHFEVKIYKNQRKGFAEVTGNLHYKFAEVSLRGILSLLIKKKIQTKRFFKNSFQANFPCLYSLKTSENLNFWFSDISRGLRSKALT